MKTTSKNYPAVLASSVDPKQLSLTIRGVLKMLIPVAMSLAPFLSVSPADLDGAFSSLYAFLDSFDTLVAAALALWAAGEVVVGAVRKVVVVLGFNWSK